jgi:hypothetical protein
VQITDPSCRQRGFLTLESVNFEVKRRKEKNPVMDPKERPDTKINRLDNWPVAVI